MLLERKRQPYANTASILEEPQLSQQRPTIKDNHINQEIYDISSGSEDQEHNYHMETEEPLTNEMKVEDLPNPTELADRLKLYGMKEKTAIRGIYFK